MAFITISMNKKMALINSSGSVSYPYTYSQTPYRIMSSPDRNTVYSVHPEGDQLSVSTGTSVSYIKVGDYPIDCTMSKDGKVAYVLNQKGKSVSIIDLVSKTVTKTISGIGEGGAGIAVDHAGKYIYVSFANYDLDKAAWHSILKRITLSDSSSKQIDLGANAIPGKLAISKNDQFAYVCCSGTNKLARIDLATFAKAQDIGVGANPIDVVISPDDLFVYVSNHSATTVSMINRSTHVVEKHITVGTNPQGIAISDDGLYLYAVNPADYTVSKVSIAEKKEIQKISISGTIPVWAATGK